MSPRVGVEASTTQKIFDAVLASVGVAMAEGEKRVDSDSEVEALGIMVSAAERCVYYPDKKKDRLRQRMVVLLEQAKTGWVAVGAL